MGVQGGIYAVFGVVLPCTFDRDADGATYYKVNGRDVSPNEACGAQAVFAEGLFGIDLEATSPGPMSVRVIGHDSEFEHRGDQVFVGYSLCGVEYVNSLTSFPPLGIVQTRLPMWRDWIRDWVRETFRLEVADPDFNLHLIYDWSQ